MAPPDTQLAKTLSDLALALQDETGLDGTLRGIAGTAVQTVPGARHAGLSVIERRRRVVTRAATDEVVELIDKLQYDTGQGPCLDAVYEQRVVSLPDFTSEQRWPDFVRAASDHGVLSMLSFQLYVRDGNLGALNLYSPVPHAFDDESRQVGLLFATHAAVAMAGARAADDLGLAISARDLIGQAKGILMERHKISADTAFHLLVRASQGSNRKLTEVAHQLTEAGEMQGTPGSS